jgi:hypothetical protein
MPSEVLSRELHGSPGLAHVNTFGTGSDVEAFEEVTRLSSTGTTTPASPACSQQATERPDVPISTSGGVSFVHRAIAKGQLG